MLEGKRNLESECVMSVLAVKSAPQVLSAVKAALSAVGDVFATIAAAGAVSHALENRRQPAAADLKILGLDRVTFNVNF